MSNNKPLSEVAAGKMATDLKNGFSIFQRPNNSLNSALPFNIESGNRYTGPSALVLLMEKRDDPRWATSNQANRNHTAVLKGAASTMISFYSQYGLRKMVDGQGQDVLRDGKPRYERVKLEQPELVEARLFNGEQMRKLPKWEKEPGLLSPVERAEQILANSGAVIEHGGEDMLYDLTTDTIYLPEMEQFASPEQYYAEAIHQLAHWTGAENRLNRQQVGEPGEFVAIREELRTNLASLFLSKELNLPYELNYHEGFTQAWSQLLKDEPGELFKAAHDAQQIVDKVLGFDRVMEQKQEQDEQMNQQVENDTHIDTPEVVPDKLSKGDVIPHNGTEFKVLAELKNKVYQMQDLGSGRKFKMSSNDELFKSLIEARSHSQERSELMIDAAAATEVSNDLVNDEQQDESYAYSR